MAIYGTDDRVAVATPPVGSYQAVVAIDTPNTAGVAYATYTNLPGSGIAIDSNHVLTANHVMSGNNNARVTPGANVSALPARETNVVPPAASLNVSNVVASLGGQDMALLTTTTSMATDANVLGMVVFYDHTDLKGLQIITAGYPEAATENPDLTARTMLTSTSSVKSTTASTFSYDADTQSGQSGSGVWLDISHVTGVLHGLATADLLAGIHTNAGNTAQRITPTIYKVIGDHMESDAGANATSEASALPVNFLVGSEKSFWSFLPWVDSGNDYMDGTYRREYFLGQSGKDRMEGGGANDTIDGGTGVDQALYSGVITDYTITITDATVRDHPKVTIAHTGGNHSEGTDTVSNVEYAVFQFVDGDSPGAAGYGQDDDGVQFFVPLLADLNDPTKLRDGELLNVGQDVLDQNTDLVGTMSLEIPAFMFDGDVNYTLTIGAKANILYNFVYIVDSSGSMSDWAGSGTKMQVTKAAYATLTQSLIDQGVAERSNFAVVDFDDTARLYDNLDAQGAINAVNSLVDWGGTLFIEPLNLAENWFESLANVSSSTNIAFFLSDGEANDGQASDSLQIVNEGTNPVTVDVRAFGIGYGPNLATLNIIDSGNAVVLTNPNDLVDAFAVSGFNKNSIDHIDVKLGGVVVDTILPNQLVDGTLGLSYQGSIDNLAVSINAENIVTFDLIFNDGKPTATIQTKITTGQTELRQQTSDGSTVVALSVNQDNYILQGSKEIVVGNELDNTIQIDTGDHSIQGMGGNDRFIINGGKAVIDGGDGTDIAMFSMTHAVAGTLGKTGNLVTVGSDFTFVGVEFIQFTDALYETSSLNQVPVATLDHDLVTISENASGTLQASFTVSLSSAAATPITLSYATSDDSATAGADYVAAQGNVVFAVGETHKTISVDILPDTIVEGDEQFHVNLSFAAGAVFQDYATDKSVPVAIQDNETVISMRLVNDSTNITEGNSGGVTNYELTAERFGDVSQETTLDWAVSGNGTTSADASDFAEGVLPEGTVTFAAGESTAVISLGIVADKIIEADEQFQLTLTSHAVKAAKLAIDSVDLSMVFTILNDDAVDSTAPTAMFQPGDGASNVAVNSNIVVTFNEDIQLVNTSGIVLHSGSASGDPVAASLTLSGDGTTLTIDPAANLANGTHYFVTFADGSILDLAGNHYGDHSDYDFSTVAAAVAATGGGSSSGVDTGIVVAGIATFGLLVFLF
jgi:V8-like Glu-specific endopeptidase